jgi:hypothetical protein
MVIWGGGKVHTGLLVGGHRKKDRLDELVVGVRKILK